MNTHLARFCLLSLKAVVTSAAATMMPLEPLLLLVAQCVCVCVKERYAFDYDDDGGGCEGTG